MELLLKVYPLSKIVYVVFLMSYVQHITTYDVDEVFCGFHFRIFDGRQ